MTDNGNDVSMVGRFVFAPFNVGRHISRSIMKGGSNLFKLNGSIYLYAAANIAVTGMIIKQYGALGLENLVPYLGLGTLRPYGVSAIAQMGAGMIDYAVLGSDSKNQSSM